MQKKTGTNKKGVQTLTFMEGEEKVLPNCPGGAQVVDE